MDNLLDACGLACPAPVLLVKEFIEKQSPETLTVVVDRESSRDSVKKFLASCGYVVEVISEGSTFKLSASCKEGQCFSTGISRAEETAEQDDTKTVVIIMSDRMGQGDDELGRKLMINYIRTLKEMEDQIWQIVFVNSGVKLVINSSAVVEELKQYVESNTIVLACGTCLEHFGLTADKAVGDATNMLDIVVATQVADKVITIG